MQRAAVRHCNVKHKSGRGAPNAGERVSLKVILDSCQRNFMIRAELLPFLIPPGEVVLVLAFSDEPKQTRVLAISASVLQRVCVPHLRTSSVFQVFFFFGCLFYVKI